jgi:hypothetical protein
LPSTPKFRTPEKLSLPLSEQIRTTESIEAPKILFDEDFDDLESLFEEVMAS